MKLGSLFGGSLLVALTCAACAADTAPEPVDPPAADADGPADERNLGQSEQALTCGVFCSRTATCSGHRPNGTPFHGSAYRCVASQCGYSYVTGCIASRGASYCAVYGAC